MLAYLNALLEALAARDASALAGLLRHPLASILPPAVRSEVEARQRGADGPLLETLRFRHQTAHLLGVSRDPATDAAPGASAQMEFELTR